jgi:Uma2 family endonuclease
MPRPGGTPHPHRFTYRDYATWPDNERWELIDGQAVNMGPAPNRQHSLVSTELVRQLANFFQGHPCEVHAAPFDVRLPNHQEADEQIDTVVQPDIVVVCDPQKLDDQGCRGAPDLVIEIVSPSTASRDHITKRDLYERHRVKEYWLVSPGDRIVTIYRLEPPGRFGQPCVHGEHETIETPLFPGLAIDLRMGVPPMSRLGHTSPSRVP